MRRSLSDPISEAAHKAFGWRAENPRDCEYADRTGRADAVADAALAGGIPPVEIDFEARAAARRANKPA